MIYFCGQRIAWYNILPRTDKGIKINFIIKLKENYLKSSSPISPLLVVLSGNRRAGRSLSLKKEIQIFKVRMPQGK